MVPSGKKNKKLLGNTLLAGTLLLTIAGLATRMIGFFYRIYLSNALGAKLLGIYQLIFPVYGICFTIFASGIQTAISKQVAERQAVRDTKASGRFLFSGITLSVSLALLLSVLLFFSCQLVARLFLREPECAKSLKLLACAFPFCGITACISGYCYGRKKSFLPATSQLVEQTVRVVFLMIAAGLWPVTCELAISALVAGEIISCTYCAFGLFIMRHKEKKQSKNKTKFPSPNLKNLPSTPSALPANSRLALTADLKKLVSISAPLTMNRLFINVLHSFESFLVPLTLRSFGLARDEALSIFGILSGMTMSFLMFPGTLTNSLSVLLLPTISEASAKNNQTGLSKAVASSIKYSVLLGVFSGFFFFFFGEELGVVVFSEKRAGTYLACLSFLCPILYVSTTLSSILNGLDKMNLTFLSSVLGLILRVVLFGALIPRLSVYGYFISLLVSQLFMTLFDLALIHRFIAFSFDAVNTLIKPSIILLATASFFFRMYEFLAAQTTLPNLALLALCAAAMTLCSIGLFAATGILFKKKQSSTQTA